MSPSADLRDLESLTVGISDFLPPWQKETAVHGFARFIADRMFLQDAQGRYVRIDEVDGWTSRSRRYPPVDIAMRAYGIGSGEMFAVPEPHGREVREGNIIRWAESNQVADSCIGYTLDLRLASDYDHLLSHRADEVFHTIFPNRVLLSRIHKVLSIYVRSEDADTFDDEPDIAALFTRTGHLKRIPPPRWARRGAGHREQGHCGTAASTSRASSTRLPAAPIRPHRPAGPRRPQRRIQPPAPMAILQQQEGGGSDRARHAPAPLLFVTRPQDRRRDRTPPGRVSREDLPTTKSDYPVDHAPYAPQTAGRSTF